MSSSTNRKSWSLNQDQTIKALVQAYGMQDWTQISSKLKQQYPQSIRSGKQCRQRWYNHLSPIISKNPWTAQQQSRLFELHQYKGNKWKDISKEFTGRTDNDLKNHFYSTLRKSLRRLNKSLGEKNSTSQMRQIKPSVLSTIMNCIYNQDNPNNKFNHLKDVPSLIFQFANIKPKKSGLSLKDDQMKDKVMRIFHFIEQFNNQYQITKVKKKQNDLIKKEREVGKKESVYTNLYTKVNSKANNQKDILYTKKQPTSQINSSLNLIVSKQPTQKQKSCLHDYTSQVQIACSSIHIPLYHNRTQQQIQDNQNAYRHNLFVGSHKKSRILDQMDELIRCEFQDIQQPSHSHQHHFEEEPTHGKTFFWKQNIQSVQKANNQHYCCTQIVDQLLDQHN